MSRMTGKRAERWDNEVTKLIATLDKLTTDSHGIYLNSKGGRLQRVTNMRTALRDVRNATVRLQSAVHDVRCEFTEKS